MTITLRQESDPQATTKGTDLTFQELDNNFIHVLNNGIIVVGDDSTGTEFTLGNTLKIAGGTGITTAMSGDTLTITASNLAQGITFVGDDSTGTLISDGETVKIAGGEGIACSVSGDTVTLNLDNYYEPTTGTWALYGQGTKSQSRPIFQLQKTNVGGTADGEVLGSVQFTGENDDGTEQEFARIFGKIQDNTQGLETGQVVIRIRQDDITNAEVLKVYRGGISVNAVGTGYGKISTPNGNGLILQPDEDTASPEIILESGDTGNIVMKPGNTDQDSAGGNMLTITAQGGDNGQFLVESGGTGGMVFANNEAENAYPTGALVLRNTQNDAEINFGQWHQGSDILYYAVYFDPNNNKFTKRVGSQPGDQNVYFGYDYQNQVAIVQGNGGDKFQIDCYNDDSQGYSNKGPIELVGGYVSVASTLPYINIKGITDSTQPPRPESSANIFAADDGGTVEMYVQDEASNITKISPHNDQGEWEYYSTNTVTGKTVRVNMEKMIKRLEDITGESFFEEYTPGKQ